MRSVRQQSPPLDIDLGLKWKAHPELGELLFLILDVIPGLGHFAMGRLKEVRWLLLTWASLVASGIFFLPGSLGFLFAGLAIGVHIWILSKHSPIRSLPMLRAKLIIAALLLALLLAIYHLVPRLCLPNLTGAYNSMTIEWNNVAPWDYFLASRDFQSGSLQRGSLVVIRPRAFGRRNTQVTIGQVVALPGEHIERKNDAFIVDNVRLDNSRYPVPMWLRGQQVSFTIAENSYFVTSEYRVFVHGRALTGNEIQAACEYEGNDIRGLVFMRWLPIGKRGFFR